MMQDQGEQTYFKRLEGEIPLISFDVSSGQAVDFVSFDRATQEFHLHEEVNDLLLDYQGNIAFVFNLGEQKVGKSFMLNKILDLEPGNCFPENSKGLKIWSTACVKDQEDLNIFFVDCQSNTGDQLYDLFVWTMAFLVGSVVILHSMGPLDSNSWTELEVLDRLKQQVRFSEEDLENEYALSHVAPKMLWMMKDFEVTIKDTNGRVMTADNYLNMELRDVQPNQTINNRKLSFLNVFKERMGFGVPKPAEPNVGFHNGQENLSEEFLYQLEHLKERIYAKTGPKLFEGVAFDSRMFLNAINCMIEVFNAQTPLYVNEMVEIVFQEEVDMLLSDGKEFYNDLFLREFPNFQDMDPMPAVQLLKSMKMIRQNTFENFTLPPQIKMKMNEEFTDCFENLQKYVENSERIFLEKNEEKAKRFDDYLAEQVMESFATEMASFPPEGPKKLAEIFSQLIEDFSKRLIQDCLSEQKSAVLARVVSEMHRRAFQKIIERQRTMSPSDIVNENEFSEKNEMLDQQLIETEKANVRAQEQIKKKREDIREAQESLTDIFQQKKDLLAKLEKQQKISGDIQAELELQKTSITGKQAELEKVKKKKKKWFCF